LTLAPLKSFQNLISITLFVDDTWSLIEAFEFSPQLQKLSLHLYDMRWFESRFEENSSDDDKEESKETKRKSKNSDEVFQNFFERLKKANSLSSLELQMDSPSDFALNKFILPMIKSLQNLERLDLLFIYGGFPLSKTPQKLDLSTLLDCIVAPKEFKSFNFSDLAVPTENPNFLITFNPKKSFSFSNASFTIDSSISEDFDFKAFFKTCFSKGSQMRPKEISLANIHVKSAKSFLKLLKIFKELGQLNGVRFHFGIALFVENMIEIKKNFKLPIIPARNVSLDVYIYLSRKTKGKLTVPSISTLQNIFGKLTFNVSFLVKEKSKKEEEKNICILAIQHNHVYVEDPDGGDHEVEHTFM